MIDSKHLAIVNIFVPLKKFTKAKFDYVIGFSKGISWIVQILEKSGVVQLKKSYSAHHFCFDKTLCMIWNEVTLTW